MREPRVQPSKSEPVEVQIMGENSLDILRARDISLRGLGVFVPHCFKGCNIDDEVQLIVTLPGIRTFHAKGVIRHTGRRSQPEGFFGVEFTELAERHREQIRVYIANRMCE